MTYQKFIKENGHLTDEGKILVEQAFMPAAREIMALAQTQNELQIIGSLLSNLIGKEVSNQLRDWKTSTAHMTDPFENETITQYFSNNYVSDKEMSDVVYNFLEKHYSHKPTTPQEVLQEAQSLAQRTKHAKQTQLLNDLLNAEIEDE